MIIMVPLNPSRRLINRCVLQCLNKNIRLYCNPTPPEKVRTYELGDFSKDLKPYLNPNKNPRHDIYLRKHRFRNEHVIIKCKDPKLNHYRGQTYEKFSPIPLVSANWRGYKSVGDYFTIKIYPDGYQQKYNNLTKDFVDSDLNPRIVEILKERGIDTMSEIQELAIPQVLKGHDCVIAAETGCGKTLAYLLPIIHQILEWKKTETRPSNSPFVVIVSPIRELTEQIKEVIKWFKELDIGSHRAVGGSVAKKIQNPVVSETDILVTTPIVIHKLLDAGLYSFKDVRHIVLDEADTLLDDSFSEHVVKILTTANRRNDEKNYESQLTLVSATMPTSIPEILGDVVDVDKMRKITTRELHWIMPHVKQKFLRVLRSTKSAYLLQLVKADYLKKSPIIVFCNSTDACSWISEFLRESGISNINLSGTDLLRRRKGKFQEFQDGKETVLISTNIASQGLDTNQVKHVLNFDFPLFMAEYVHRCGRTGRLGSNVNGQVTNFISCKNEIPLVQKIELAVRCNIELENVNSNIKRILKFRGASPVEKKLGVA